MARPDQGSGGGAPAAAAALTTQTSCACACSCRGVGVDEPAAQHERKLSSAASFSSPASTTYLPASSHKSSCESLAFAEPELGNQSSFSSTSYESFFHIDPDHDDGSKFLDFEPAATRPPAVQTMMTAQGQGGAAAVHDPKRLPSSMFRTRSTSPAEWSAISNESLFSIQLSHSGDLGALYADLYYDDAGLPRFPSVGREAAAALRLPFLSWSSGAPCVRHDCARCSGTGTGMVRKSVRFAAVESVVSGDGKQSTVTTLEVAMEEVEAPAAIAAKTSEAAAGWCEFGCCWPATPTAWWPRCCACYDCGCHCKWWL